MNIVDAIRSQVSNEQLNQLGSLVGSNDETARAAVNAAVPSLLAALGKLVSGDGVARVVNALMRFAPGSADSRSAGNATDQARQGGDVLGNLFGNSSFNAIVGALSKFGGLGQDGMRKLLGWLAPVILGGVAKEFTGGRKLDSQGVASFFSEQRSNIDNALPMGLSMADMPGLGTPAPQEGGSSSAKWLVPAAALAMLAVGGVFWFNRDSPTLSVPSSPGEVRASVADACKTMTARLEKIKDVDSAQAAMPDLKKVAAAFAGMKPVAEKMTPADKGKVKETIESNVAKLDEQFARLVWVPGVSEKIKPAVSEIMEKMGSLVGTSPETRVSNVSAELSKTFRTINETVSGIKDPVTATEALPKLKDIEGKLTEAKEAMDKLPEAGRATLSEVVKPELEKLRQTIEKMLAQNGVGEKCKPAVDAIMTKLNSMVG
jgi:hypothetical protein